MKKLFSLLLALLLLAAMMPAQAQEALLAQAPNLPPPAPEGSGYVYVDRIARANVVQVTTLAAPRLGQVASWSFEPIGISGDVTYRVTVCEYGTGTVPTVYTSPSLPAGQNTFSYTFYETGQFYLLIYAKNAQGQEYKQWQIVEVADVPGQESVTSRVKEIVAECRANVSGEYETALWLHDWIVTHAYYDYSFSFRDADGILFHGKGVCDSYSKLYDRLLKEAGFECQRVSGTANGGSHAWNIVKIDGEWCHVDATWDDPGSAETAVSGKETHQYFGINDEFLRQDHAYSCDIACDSLANYSLYREGQHRIWMYHILPEIEQNLASGITSFDVDTMGIAVAKIMDGGRYSYYGSKDYVDKVSYISSVLLGMDDWTLQNGSKGKAVFTYDSEKNIMHVEAARPALHIPAGTETIGAKAFMNSAVEEVFIPASVKKIGSYAFAGCDSLKVIHFEDGDHIEVAQDFLAGTSGDIIIDAPVGSKVYNNISVYMDNR